MMMIVVVMVIVEKRVLVVMRMRMRIRETWVGGKDIPLFILSFELTNTTRTGGQNGK